MKNILDKTLEDIASFKACCPAIIEDILGRAIISAITKELIRLGYDEYESVRFDAVKMRKRYMGDTMGVCYYGTTKDGSPFGYCEIDGKCYALMEEFRTDDELGCNRTFLYTDRLETLKKIFDYLRLERRSNSLKKR